MGLLKKVAHSHNTAVLVVTHDHRAIDVYDRIFIMEDGKLSASATLRRHNGCGCHLPAQECKTG